jgi:hypothetical protein
MTLETLEFEPGAFKVTQFRNPHATDFGIAFIGHGRGGTQNERCKKQFTHILPPVCTTGVAPETLYHVKET